MSRLGWRHYLAGGVAVLAAYPLLPLGLPRDLVYAVVGASAAAAALAAARRSQPATGPHWRWLAAGTTAWVVADLVYNWRVDGLHVQPSPSAADLCYLLGYLLLGVGLALLARRCRSGIEVSSLVDSAVVTIAAALLSWVLLVAPAAHRVGLSPAERWLDVAYPLVDVVLLGQLLRVLTTATARTPALRLLVGAITVLFVGDTLLSASPSGSAGTPGDLLWLGSYLLLGAAALHPSAVRPAAPAAGPVAGLSGRRLTALTAAVLVAPGVLAVELVTRSELHAWAVVACSVALLLLVVGRMQLAVRAAATSGAQRDRLRDDLVHLAAHDALTSLANRARVLELTEAALHRGRRSGTGVAVLHVDLDHFKAVNDGLGPQAGDEVLRRTAARMTDLVRAGDTVGRLGADEFVVLLEPAGSATDLVDLADRLAAALAKPIDLTGRQVRIGASIGIAVDDEGGVDATRLLHHADVAVHRAKSGGRGRVEVFDDHLRRELDERAHLEAEIRRGLELGEFVLHYQPVVDLRTGGLHGYEALLRWQRPGHGFTPPDAFIPTAEQSELICELGRWVLREATRQLATWRASDPEGCADLTVAVNVSGRQLTGPGLLDDVREALAECGLPARLLVLEITETVLVDQPSAAEHLAELRGLGVAISIDDFGTGYTSIAQLRHLHVDVLKIDKSFVSASGEGTRELVMLMIHAAHAFGLQVVAEGIERADQLGPLRDLACDLGQGYYFARPQAAGALSPLPRPLPTALPAAGAAPAGRSDAPVRSPAV